MSVETNKTLVKQYLDALNNNDTATLDRLMSPEQAKIAKEQILPYIAAHFGNHLLRAANLIAEGDQVAAKIESSGTHIGEFYGLPATGNAWTNRGFAIVRIADSRIVELESLFDIENHIAQLGGKIVPDTEKNKELVRHFQTSLWGGDTSVVDSMLSADYQSPMGTHEQIKSFVSFVRSIFPEFTFVINELLAEGDKVVLHWTMSGVNRGESHLPDGTPLPPPNKPFSYNGITINHIVNGKIVSDVFENGWLKMLMEMGVKLG